MELQTFPPSDRDILNRERSLHLPAKSEHASDQAAGDSGATTELAVKPSVWPARIQFMAVCFPVFLAGWSDGTIGPLLPRIREVYHIGFAIVSLLFAFSSVGFISGAMANVHFNDKYGFGKMLFIGSVFQLIAFSLMAAALPYPVFVIAFVINAIGGAIQDAQANGYVAALKDNSETKMGILHATYGAGALCSPLVSTQFAQMKHWSFHYLISVGIALANTAIVFFVYRLKTQDECLAQIGQPPAPVSTSNSDNRFKQILGFKSVHLLSMFILVYVGVEVTIGGWIVEYLIDVRGGGPSAGYSSAGFFGGLMVGRVALLWLNKLIGERRAIFLYIVIAIGLEFVIWFVPSLIGNAVAVGIVGVLLGPMYPLAMNHAGRVLPRWVLTGSIGWIASFGQAGSAIVPLITAALASKFGIQSLQPLLVAMMALMTGVWWLVPGRVISTD